MLEKMPIKNRYLLIGEILTLFISSILHRKYSINQFAYQVIPALDLNQFRIYKINEKPVGFVSWAFFNNDLEEIYKQSNYLIKEEDWKKGDRLWFIDFIAPFGHASEIIKDLRENIFPDSVGKYLSTDKNGDFEKVITITGKNKKRR
jgi:cytolysin-activating lysine-acyltransferase